MRVWDLEPARLCRAHLLGEHREIHALDTVIRGRRRGYAAHPETRRWSGRLPALRRRHDRVAAEMARRGYRHATPFPRAGGRAAPPPPLLAPRSQARRLRARGCGCDGRVALLR